MNNLFEMGANFEDEWTSDNKNKSKIKTSKEIKPPAKHMLHTAKERRRGKVVTIVKPFHLSKSDLAALLKTLKQSLGAGGTIKENSIEIQGDIAQKAKSKLLALGYRFKS